MSLPDTPSQRKHKWIVPNLRGRMALWLVAAPALAATTVTWAVLFLLWSPILDHAGSPARSADAVFWGVCMRVLLTSAALAVIFGIVALIAARVVSHRVAGPLHRLGKVAQEVANGHHYERVRLRDGDYIEDFAETFNDMLDCFQARTRFQRNRMRAVQKYLSDLETALKSGPVSTEELQDRLRECLRIVQDARLGNPEEETPVLY
jgi:methyl-accepting chemotaxis protein